MQRERSDPTAPSGQRGVQSDGLLPTVPRSRVAPRRFQDRAALPLRRPPIPATSARRGATPPVRKQILLACEHQNKQPKPAALPPRGQGMPLQKVARLRRHREKSSSSRLQAQQRRARRSLHVRRILSRYIPASASPVPREGKRRPSIWETGITPSLLLVRKHSSAPLILSSVKRPSRTEVILVIH